MPRGYIALGCKESIREFSEWKQNVELGDCCRPLFLRYPNLILKS